MISQRLLPRTNGGRVPSIEVMVTNARIQDLIREDRPDEITDAIAAGEYFQMQTFAQSLIELVVTGVIDREVAANSATNRHDFLVALERAEKEQAAERREAEAAVPPRMATAMLRGLSRSCARRRFRGRLFGLTKRSLRVACRRVRPWQATG